MGIRPGLEMPIGRPDRQAARSSRGSLCPVCYLLWPELTGNAVRTPVGFLAVLCPLRAQAATQGEWDSRTGRPRVPASAAGSFAGGGTQALRPTPRSAAVVPACLPACLPDGRHGCSPAGRVHLSQPPPASGSGPGSPSPARSTLQQPRSPRPESLRRGKFGGAPAAETSRVAREARPRLAASPPLPPSPGPPKFGSPAIFLAPLPCEA